MAPPAGCVPAVILSAMPEEGDSIQVVHEEWFLPYASVDLHHSSGEQDKAASQSVARKMH